MKKIEEIMNVLFTEQEIEEHNEKPQLKQDHAYEVLLRMLRPQKRSHGLGHPLWSLFFHRCHPWKHSHQVIHDEFKIVSFLHFKS
jgi:hypothetical protein